MSYKIRKFISGIFILCLTTQVASTATAQFLGGTLLGTTIVEAEENPWSVIQTVIIPEGDTLIIGPGVELFFTIGSYIEVRGTIIATGTSELPIVCNKQIPNPQNIRWGGFKLINTKSELDSANNYVSGSILEHITINDATDGLTLSDSADVFAHSLIIRDCSGNGIMLMSGSKLRSSNLHLEACSIGINVTDNSQLDLMSSTIDNCSFGISFNGISENNRIGDCEIMHCFSGVMFLTDPFSKSHNLIENCNISYNNSVGVFISATNSKIQHNIIRNNTVSFNSIGLHIGNGTVGDNGYNLIAENKVHNNDFGIKISQSNDTIRYNEITNNGNGILLNRASYNQITRNVLHNNTEWGIKLEEGSDSNVIDQNNLFDNGKGIIISYKDNIPSAHNTVVYNTISGTDTTFRILSGPQEAIHYNSFVSTLDSASFINEFTSDVNARFNYWGTIDTVAIDRSIIDIYDNPSVGEVIYKPFIEMPDPDAPISKPQMVLKRLVNNAVTVTWRPNKETDLSGYKVYYGSNIVNTLLDTLVTIPDILLTESIRVTAYDTDADGLRDQVEGHESAFAEAIAAPWAGSDASICSGDNYFTSVATAIDYQQLTWTSDGDGTFADASTLHTYYVPGANDINSGSVKLTLKVISTSDIELFDEIDLQIMEFLVLEAGKDTSVTEGNKLLIIQSSALNYTSLQWSTSGDGVFSDADTLITEYIPGPEDTERGSVFLKIRIISGCGSLEDSFRLDIIPGFDITGTVSKEGQVVSGSMVLAFNNSDDITRAVISAQSNEEGIFILPNVTEGEYYIFAVPDPAEFEDYLPTYYAQGSQWQEGYLMPVNKDVYDVDIKLSRLDITLPTGTGTINGYFTYEGTPGIDFDIYNRNWFNENQITPPGGPSGNHYPAANHAIYLMNSELTKVIGWTLSNLDGSFSFSGLPYGAYKLWGEKAGYNNRLSQVIYITPENPSIVGIELSADSEEKVIESNTPATFVSDGIIYPNPAIDNFIINAEGFDGEMSVGLELINQKGISVKKLSVERISASSFGPVTITGIAKGFYICIITSPAGERKTVKLTVN